MLEYRRVQHMGGGALTITIPIEYARKYDIKKGDTLVIQEAADGALRIEKVKI